MSATNNCTIDEPCPQLFFNIYCTEFVCDQPFLEIAPTTAMLALLVGLSLARVNVSFFAGVHVISMHPERVAALRKKLSASPRIWGGATADDVRGMCRGASKAAQPQRACTVAHLRVLKHISTQKPGQWHLIFEDDVTPSAWVSNTKNWASLVTRSTPSSTQFLNLGPSVYRPSFQRFLRHPLSTLSGLVQTRGGSRGPFIILPGSGTQSHAYMLTTKAAGTLAGLARRHVCDASNMEIDVLYTRAQHSWMSQVHLLHRKPEWDQGVQRASTSGLFAQRALKSDISIKSLQE